MEKQISKSTKYLKIIALLLLAELFSLPLQANPGDTTVVTVWNLRKLTQYGNYDTSAVFPTGKRYRKIRMHYILGRYACPGNPQYCGSWDYTTQIFARPANNDSVEIARVITPYATDWLSLNKKHDYVVEVTGTTALPGILLRAPTHEGMAFCCRDTALGDLSLKLWQRRGSKLDLVVAATSTQAGLEVGGGPWDEPWIKG